MTEATQRDHIIPLAEGGVEDEANENNIQATCDACHKAKTEEEVRRGVRRALNGEKRPKVAPKQSTTDDWVIA